MERGSRLDVVVVMAAYHEGHRSIGDGQLLPLLFSIARLEPL